MADLEDFVRQAAKLQAEVNAAGMGDPRDAEIAQLVEDNNDLRAEAERLRLIEQAARNLDAHKDEGYASLVSYLIRLHEALHP